MKNIVVVLLTVAGILILPGCKKAIESLLPPVVDTPESTPVGIATGDLVSKTIDKSGGSIMAADGNTELIFPAGALDQSTAFSIQAITNYAPNGVGNAYRFLPEGIKFSQPITLKFHYTAHDLASTLPDLMGIATQDINGAWYRVNNFTTDASNKTISAPITHFSDWTMFNVMNITPSSAALKVNQTLNMEVTYVNTGSDDDELSPLGIEKVEKITWFANSSENGSPSAGTITVSDGTGKSVIYKAPSKVPAKDKNPVAVSAQIQIKFKYHGKTFDKTSLVSNVTIIDGEKYLLEIRETETADPFIYTDTASLTVLISADGKVTFSDISNFAPKINQVSATAGDCTTDWISDDIGEINITSVEGQLNGSPGDPDRELILQFNHSGTVSPKFHRLCSINDDVTEGGIPIRGFPTLLSFTLTPDAGIYFQDDGQEFARLTLIE